MAGGGGLLRHPRIREEGRLHPVAQSRSRVRMRADVLDAGARHGGQLDLLALPADAARPPHVAAARIPGKLAAATQPGWGPSSGPAGADATAEEAPGGVGVEDVSMATAPTVSLKRAVSASASASAGAASAPS
ncbi:hypothetical protein CAUPRSCDRAFT_12356 [Caulochytrium protostelioides]|uniref:Uncharacterized protein n=1 Tax=Caulochytrium protostelioides TaxID=1555241 RepID=A0A4P9WUJ0_9FUNG|nr:hypothetical protein CAUPRSCDRAFT_12356 [Caulochytrium protostelioides]